MRSPLRFFLFVMAASVVSRTVRGQQPVDTVHVSTRASSRGGFTVEVIDRAWLDRLPGLSLAQLLARGLGVDVQMRSAASADLSVRGGSYQQTLVLLDGVRMSDAQTAHFSLDLPVPLDEIERIEILRGGASALHGPDAAGGVVNIVTHRGAARSVRVEGGSFGTARATASVGIAGDRGSARIAAEYATSDGHRAGTDYDVQQLRVALERPVRAVQLGLDAAYSRRDFGANAFYGPYNSVERTGTSTLALRAERATNARGAARAVLSYRRHDDDFVLRRENPAAYENRHTNTMLLGELAMRQAFAGDVVVAAGVEAAHLALASFRLGDRAETRLATFVEVSSAVAMATVTAAGRLDHGTATGDAFSPSLTISVPLAPHLTARTALARGVRAPSWTERYYVDPANRGNPALRTETFWTADLALFREFARGRSAELTLFGRRSRDLIDWTRPAAATVGVPWTAMNVGAATLHGVELAAVLPRVAGVDWRVRAQGTRFSTDMSAELVGKFALRPLTTSGGVTATRALGRRWSVSADVAHARRAREEGYSTVDARLAWQRGAWRFTMDGTNLAHARWIDVAGYPAAGPGVSAGLSWSGR